MIVVQAEPLQELWAATCLAQIETKTGAITLVNAQPRKRAKKRRRIEEPDASVDGEQGQQDPPDNFQEMENYDQFDPDQGAFFEGDDFGAMSRSSDPVPCVCLSFV